MSPVFDCSAAESRDEAIQAAAEAIARGECVVMPTDTVYGIAADAFNAPAVGRLLEAKGRGREMPPPVLIPSRMTVDGLAMALPSYVSRLMDAFWPGGLTLVLRAQQSLAWDLGDTNGTVALRMPDDEIALALLQRTGPLAVSSANRTGKPSATTVTEAGFMLGHFVDVYLDGGERGADTSSTIVDCTKPDPVVLREGTITNEQLREVLAGVGLVTGQAINSEPDLPPPPALDPSGSAESVIPAVDLTKPDEPVATDTQSDIPTLGAQWGSTDTDHAVDDAKSANPDTDQKLG
ncbi:L-threonylcarbamoyladenylate synthase [Rudaeicoccus suwonensis]|uniref:L-threonylcarbamoyladenylate synthase n=1 Tax=Rudaeicoccus suwonensis TaxID=657409 RepID=A0A561DXA0_9MICO|nr:L-threonylcarbamoyladenylate synthase [Rudaeicoccus suwonensis]TWE07983.1 translation factor SUA5 [Rudaeicoccus suwonensis]